MPVDDELHAKLKAHAEDKDRSIPAQAARILGKAYKRTNILVEFSSAEYKALKSLAEGQEKSSPEMVKTIIISELVR